jgi:hypothetical protein
MENSVGVEKIGTNLITAYNAGGDYAATLIRVADKHELEVELDL